MCITSRSVCKSRVQISNFKLCLIVIYDYLVFKSRVYISESWIFLDQFLRWIYGLKFVIYDCGFENFKYEPWRHQKNDVMNKSRIKVMVNYVKVFKRPFYGCLIVIFSLRVQEYTLKNKRSCSTKILLN